MADIAEGREYGMKGYGKMNGIKIDNEIIDLMRGAESTIGAGNSWEERIPIDDGGVNSYIGLRVQAEDSPGVTGTAWVKLWRNTNVGRYGTRDVAKLLETWDLSLGDVCVGYTHMNGDVPIRLTTYGKTPEEICAEIKPHIGHFRKAFKKAAKILADKKEKAARDEKDKLLARLKELEAVEAAEGEN
jgi:hypothetical protein